MQVGKFEKVSFEQFLESMKDMQIANEWEFYKAYVHDLYEQIKLPTRATSGSAGYDFRAPFSFTLHPGDTIKIPTGIRVKIEPGWWLACVPRSGLGLNMALVCLFFRREAGTIRRICWFSPFFPDHT